MTKFQLKQKPKRLKLQSQLTTNDPFANAVIQMKGERTEENILTLLLETYNEYVKIKCLYNQWLNLGQHLPPCTNETILIYDMNNFFGKNITSETSFTFLQHYLMSKYFYGFKNRPSFEGITHFMLISEPK